MHEEENRINKPVTTFFRICNYSLKMQLGESKCSTKKIFEQSKRNECLSSVLAEICIIIGISFTKSLEPSNGYCRLCARKIYTAIECESRLVEELTENFSSSSSSPMSVRKTTPAHNNHSSAKGQQTNNRMLKDQDLLQQKVYSPTLPLVSMMKRVI